MKIGRKLLPTSLLVGFMATVLVLFSTSATAETDNGGQTVQNQINQLEIQIKALKAEVAATKEQATTAMSAIAPVVDADDSATIKFSMHGAVVGGFNTNDNKMGMPKSNFTGAQFMPIFLAQYKDWLLFEGHLEFTNAHDVSLEYSQLDARVNDSLTIVVGKFLSPIGQFQQAQHPPWINKLPTRPAGFVEDGGDEPLNEVGMMARGGMPAGDMTFTYLVFIGNGPQLAEGPALEGFSADNNNNKSVGGRFSLLPIPSLEIAVSFMHAVIPGEKALGGESTSANYNLGGADFAYTSGPLEIRGEYLHSRLGDISTALTPADALPTDIPSTTWSNWYIQGSYRFSGFTDDPVYSKFEPVVRYSNFKVKGYDDWGGGQEKRLSVGLDYWFGPSVVTKVAYEHRKLLASDVTVNAGIFQFVYGF